LLLIDGVVVIVVVFVVAAAKFAMLEMSEVWFFWYLLFTWTKEWAR